MTDVNDNEIKLGDIVKHRHQSKYPLGTIKKIEEGCNPLCWVDFGVLIMGKALLTICSSYDIIKKD
jgi:hypothetical protein